MEVTYEYTAYTDASDYNVNPEYLVDQDDDTYGAATAGVGAKVVNFCTNLCPGTNLGKITKVEILAKAQSQNSADTNYVKANYGGAGTYGDNNDISTGTGVTEEFEFDITEDTNAPDPWAWSDVQGLDLYFNGNVASNGLRVYYGKIRITYSPVSGGLGVGSPWIFMKDMWKKHNKIFIPKKVRYAI